MKKWVIFLILSIGFCITSVSCIKESSTFHWSVDYQQLVGVRYI